MAKPLKYQSLIDGLTLSLPCPDNCNAIDKIAYRWVKSDFSDGQSFLPNFIYDQNRGKKPRKNDPGDEIKCGNCALSFFDSAESSTINAEAMGGASKVIKLLGYTHLAHGQLSADDGIASELDGHGHFLFFEFQGVFLDPKFKILHIL